MAQRAAIGRARATHLRRRMAACLVTALLGGLGAVACTKEYWPVQGEGAPGIDATQLNEDVKKYLGDNDVAGATVAVTRGSRLVWSTSYGWANEAERIHMQPWHRSRIGSTSKVITAIGFLRLLESASGGGNLGGFGTSSNLQNLLSRKLYGHPGSDWASPSWPNVTGPTALANPEEYWEALKQGVNNFYEQPNWQDMDRMIEWASSIEVRHLLTHTSGHLRSGAVDAAAEYFGTDPHDLTYSEAHQYMLMGLTLADESSDDVACYLNGQFYVDSKDAAYTGQDYPMPPLRYEPGTKRCYSNHGFGIIGMIIDEMAGPGDENTYRGVIEREILEPLGLFDVAPNDIEVIDEDDETNGVDAFPHGSDFGEADTTGLGWATGGWSATAKDLARIMCGIDRESNNLRLLAPSTVTVMETVAFPTVSSTQPLGWDSRSGLQLTKNGRTGGGSSRITKYLPGRFATAPDDEINVAVMFNDDVSPPSESLLNTIASRVADANIPDDYDLFDPAYACMLPEPEPSEPGLAVPQPTLTATPAPPPLGNPATPAPTTPPTRLAPPTVTIALPASGQHIAPNGLAAIAFTGQARTPAGSVIPGTYYRWTATQGTTKTVLCEGSNVNPTTSTGIGGLTTTVDCTGFSRTLQNPFPGAGPPITIRLEAWDPAGTMGSATVTISLVTPPVG